MCNSYTDPKSIFTNCKGEPWFKSIMSIKFAKETSRQERIRIGERIYLVKKTKNRKMVFRSGTYPVCRYYAKIISMSLQEADTNYYNLNLLF